MIVDTVLVYKFIKRLVTPFNKWDAFKLGIIDADGKILKNESQRKSVKEREAFTPFDILVLNIKKLLEKIPGGSTKLGSYAAALWLMREYNENSDVNENSLREYVDYTLNEYNVNREFEKIFEEGEGIIANAVGNGENVEGIGPGKKGEPGFSKKSMKNYKKNNAIFRRLPANITK
jgi:hypothetical protein